MKQTYLFLFLLVVVGSPFEVGAQMVKDYSYYFEKGKHLSDNDSFRLATAILDTAIKLNPNSYEAYEWRGFCKVHNSLFVEGLKDYDTAILYADNKNKLRLIETKEIDMSGLKASKYFSEAQILEVYNTAINLMPDSSKVYIDRSRYYRTQKNYKDAVADVKKAIEINPSPFNYLNLVSIMRYRNKNLSQEETLKVYDECIEKNPTKAEAYFIRGNYYEGNQYRTKNLLDSSKNKQNNERIEWGKKAISDYDKAISLEPSNWKYYSKRVNVKELSHGYSSQEILNDYNELIAVIPSKSSGYMQKANYYARIDKYKEAISCLDSAIHFDTSLFYLYASRALWKEYLGTYKADEIKADLEKTGTENVGRFLDSKSWADFKKIWTKYGMPQNLTK